MVLTIVFATIALVIAVVLLVLFSPLQAGVHFSLSANHVSGSFRGSFLHPQVISVAIDLTSQDISVRLFGWSIGRKASRAVVNDDVQESGRTAPPLSEDATIRPLPEKESGFPGAPTAVRANVMEPAPVLLPETAVLPGDVDVNPNSGAVKSSEKIDRVNNRMAAPPPRQGTSSPSEEKVAAAKEKKDNWFERLRDNRYVFFIRNNAWRSKVLRWGARVVKAVFHIVRFDRFAVSVRGGVEDPMVTGIVTGLYRSIAGALAARPPFAISFEPVFMANRFECTGMIGMRTSVMQMSFPVVVAVATFPSLHTLYLWWRSTRLRKRRDKKAGT